MYCHAVISSTANLKLQLEWAVRGNSPSDLPITEVCTSLGQIRRIGRERLIRLIRGGLCGSSQVLERKEVSGRQSQSVAFPKVAFR